jgi:hypothetical protein
MSVSRSSDKSLAELPKPMPEQRVVVLWLPAKRKKTPIRRQLSQQWVAPLIFT